MGGMLVSCSTESGALDVNSVHLREIRATKDERGLVRAEQRKLLYGAVTMEERRARLGQYYKVRWDVGKLDVSPSAGATEVVFRYHQAGTASKELRKAVRYDAGVEQGVAEFEVKGASYHENGRVLTWRVELRRNGEVLDSRQSYLWE